MLRVILFFIVALFAVSHGAPAEAELEGRIIGGENAPPGSAKYQVSLRSSSNTHFCGGSILNARTIVTAAHCVVGVTASNIIVVVGTHTLNSGGTKYEVSKLIPHPSYNGNLIVNDLAVVITSEPIAFEENVEPIALSTSETGGDVTVTLTGWGLTSYPGSAPNNLQMADLKTITYTDCKKALSAMNSVYETQICTFTRAGQGACHEDSGGPLVADGKLVGVVSWGYPCAKGYPDVFTRVSSFVQWINSNAQS